MKRRSKKATLIGMALFIAFTAIPVTLLALNQVWAIATLVVIWNLVYIHFVNRIIEVIQNSIDMRMLRERGEGCHCCNTANNYQLNYCPNCGRHLGDMP